jgi:putative oxidoreductase
MKIAVIIVRILMGLLLLVSAISFFFNLMTPQKMGEGATLFVTGMVASIYMFPVVKVLEIIVGLSFIFGRFVPLATVVIFPIVLNIVLFHAFLAPEGMAVPVFLLAGNLFLAYTYRKNYETLVVAK